MFSIVASALAIACIANPPPAEPPASTIVVVAPQWGSKVVHAMSCYSTLRAVTLRNTGARPVAVRGIEVWTDRPYRFSFAPVHLDAGEERTLEGEGLVPATSERVAGRIAGCRPVPQRARGGASQPTPRSPHRALEAEYVQSDR